MSLEQALSHRSPRARERRGAAEAVTAALEPGLRTRGYIYNTLVADKAVEDRLRPYPNWLAGRNLANEASDESVMALIEAVRARYDIPQRWYRLKARLLGVERLADYDRTAPVLAEDGRYSYGQARELVLDTYAAFSPRPGELAGRFFEGRWIDAPVRPDKRGGAFCAYTVPCVHPYVLLNYTGRRRDVLMLAHELGHGVHAALAQPRACFTSHAADRGRDRVDVRRGARVRAPAGPDENRPSGWPAGRVDRRGGRDGLSPGRDEPLRAPRPHRPPRQGELSVERFNELWMETQAELFGDSVEITDGYRMWWSYIPHFINTPGYVYAYAYGQLLALSVYARYARRASRSSQLPRAAGRRRLAKPRGARRDGRDRPGRPGLLGRRPGAGRGAAGRGRGGRRRVT